MANFLRAVWILFAVHVRRTFVSLRALLALGLAFLPVGASLLVVQICKVEGPPPLDAILHMGWFFQVQTIVPLIALVVGTAVVSEEIEDRTITYLFTRPIPRASILFGRGLAAVLLVLLLLGAACSLVLSILRGIGPADSADLPAGFEQRLFFVVLLGGAVYTALFAAAGALFKWPVIVGLGYTFVVEGFLANLPAGNQKLTMQYYLKSILISGDPVLLENFEESIALVKLADPSDALRTLVLVLVTALALGAWRLSRREYVLSA